MKYGIIAAAFLIGFGLIASMQFESKKTASREKLNTPAPDFSLKNVAGETISLSQYKGKMVYIKFWASWCRDCVKEVIPQRKLEASFADNEAIKFLNISIDDSEDAWRKAVQRNKLMAEELISHDGDENQINDKYNISEIPRYILISKDGLILDYNAPHPSEIEPEYFSQFN